MRGAWRRRRRRHAADLLIVMRVYFEKPRTTVGWKGLINDPYLDGSFRINEGLRLARSCCSTSTSWACRPASEYLDMITPQYIADLVSLGRDRRAHHRIAGAPRTRLRACPARSDSRTAPTAMSASPWTRSRPRASRTISCRSPRAGTRPSSPPTATRTAMSSCAAGTGPTTTRPAWTRPAKQLAAAGLAAAPDDRLFPRQQPKDYQRQIEVCADVAGQIAAGDDRIIGVMAESHLHPGRQDLVPGNAARLRRVNHRRLHRLGRQRQDARATSPRQCASAAWCTRPKTSVWRRLPDPARRRRRPVSCRLAAGAAGGNLI